jgi:hypothetical protein
MLIAFPWILDISEANINPKIILENLFLYMFIFVFD